MFDTYIHPKPRGKRCVIVFVITPHRTTGTHQSMYIACCPVNVVCRPVDNTRSDFECQRAGETRGGGQENERETQHMPRRRHAFARREERGESLRVRDARVPYERASGVSERPRAGTTHPLREDEHSGI